MRISMPAQNRSDLWALVLRVGLGAVFVIGGWSKLSQLIDPSREGGLVATYMGPHGYINRFFAEYLFTGQFGDWLTPWVFLTTLSTFELTAGIALIAGFLVRPLALVFGFMLWSFVFALPVATAPGIAVTVDTFTAPAMLVQIRDIALSGMMFVLFNLGAGALSLDARLFAAAPDRQPPDWNSLGLLLRLSIAAPLLVGGAFTGLSGIQSFAASGWILLPAGVLLASGTLVHPVGIGIAAIMIYYIGHKLNADASLIANLNGFKRELAFLAAGAVLAAAGGGNRFTVAAVVHQKGWLRPFHKTLAAE